MRCETLFLQIGGSGPNTPTDPVGARNLSERIDKYPGLSAYEALALDLEPWYDGGYREIILSRPFGQHVVPGRNKPNGSPVAIHPDGHILSEVLGLDWMSAERFRAGVYRLQAQGFKVWAYIGGPDRIDEEDPLPLTPPLDDFSWLEEIIVPGLGFILDGTGEPLVSGAAPRWVYVADYLNSKGNPVAIEPLRLADPAIVYPSYLAPDVASLEFIQGAQNGGPYIDRWPIVPGVQAICGKGNSPLTLDEQRGEIAAVKAVPAPRMNAILTADTGLPQI